VRAFEDIKIVQAITIAAGAAGASAVNGAGLDTAGFQGGVAVVEFGPIVSGAATSIKLQQSSDDGASDSYGDVEGTSQTVADTDDNTVFYCDFHRATKQYVRIVVSRATQNATCSAMYYLYGANNHPVSHGSTVQGESFTSAAEGTA